ncbi:MAG: hypothetical protein PF638_04545 [Candidatus Delongbacteria bacterium]|jgi:hypothetical protein|nr:hypothetical protein [Candidatus Delongbacteria bacterium]
MKTILKKYKKELPNLTIEPHKYYHKYLDGEEEKGTIYYIYGFEGNPEVQFRFETKEEANELFKVAKKNPYVFPDFLAIECNNVIEILLTNVSFRTSLKMIDIDEDSFKKFFQINMHYYKNDLKIEFEMGKNTKNTLPALLKFLRGARRFSRRATILKIFNYNKPTLEGIDNDVRNIISSVLFDIEYSYDIALETINIDGLSRRVIRRRKKRNELPQESIDLVYKKYIPELIQYFHTAEKVDFAPFKFITYYHILEYHSDKSAYRVISDEVKKLLLKPDFHIKTSLYINQAIKIFKKENEKHTTDKIKIERVLRQFVDREELKKTLIGYEILDHFKNEATLDCTKPLKLPGIDFDKDSNFYNNLTKRIYSLRCSIVHSNPDFDESKGIPFIPSPKNIEILRNEIEMIAEIARNVIIDSKEE